MLCLTLSRVDKVRNSTNTIAIDRQMLSSMSWSVTCIHNSLPTDADVAFGLICSFLLAPDWSIDSVSRNTIYLWDRLNKYWNSLSVWCLRSTAMAFYLQTGSCWNYQVHKWSIRLWIGKLERSIGSQSFDRLHIGNQSMRGSTDTSGGRASFYPHLGHSVVSLSKTLHFHCLVLVKPRKPSQSDWKIDDQVI